MTRGAKGCLLAAVGMMFILVVVAAAIMLTGRVRRDTILDLTISGEIVEDYEDTLAARMFRGKVTMLRDLTLALDTASRDEHVKGLVARIKPFQMGVAKIQELRDGIIAFRASGKWAHVYLDSAGEFSSANGLYYLATAFDEIWLAPSGDLNLHGLLGVTPFYRGLLDKLGIYPDMNSIGEYKNAKDIYTEKEMTPAHREATTAYLKDWYDQIVAGIASERELDAAQVDAIIQKGPFLAQEALEMKLVDHLAYHDEFLDAMKTRNEGDLTLMRPEEYHAKTQSSRGTRIAVVTGMGVIFTGRSAQDPWGGALMGSETVAQALRDAREDSGVKAIVFRVDSPGGSALASDLIWREVNLAAKEKPVIVSHSDVAASGGYYVSMGATKVVAMPGTITGSIGVVAGKMVTKGFNDWIGLNYEAIKMGNNATYYYTGKPYSDTEREVYWKFMHRIYDDFTGKVAESRGKTVEEVDAIGRGRVWTGARAVELGLVDELGGFTDAIRIAREEAGIPEDDDVKLVYLPAKRTFYQSLFWSEEETRAVVPMEVTAALREIQHVMMLSRENVWMLADTPYLVP